MMMLRYVGLFPLVCLLVGTGFAQPQPNGSVQGRATHEAKGPSANSVTRDSNTQPRVKIRINGSATSNPSNLAFIHPDFSLANAPAIFAANPAPAVPVIDQMFPSQYAAGWPTFELDIYGQGFRSNSVVRWNGQDRATTVEPPLFLSAIITQADLLFPGTAQVTVFNPGPNGGTSNSVPFPILHDAPTLTSISPNAVNAGSAGIALVCTGNNFHGGSVVFWNGSPRSTTFVSLTQVVATIPAADLVNAAVIPVVANNPAPGGGNSQTINFTVNNPSPTVVSLSPGSANVSGAGFSMLVTGAGFNSQSIVRWNGSDRTTVLLSPTSLMATIPASDLASAGTANVSVFNPAPGGGTSANAPFNINNPVPAVVSLSPGSANVGGPGFSMLVTGVGFNSQSIVRWNGSDRTTVLLSSTSLMATIPASDLASAGTANVSVFNPAPGGGTSANAPFNINNPVPAVVSLSPGSANVGGPGFSMLVTGAGFNSQSIVRWNGSDRTTILLSSTSLMATIPASDLASAGTANVSVFNPAPGGGTSANAPFNINNPVPAVVSLSPGSANVGGPGFSMLVTGAGFNSQSIVRWNGSDRTTILLSSTSLMATIPASDIANAGTANVSVFNPAPGGGTSAPVPFAINNPTPVIVSLSPTSVTAGGAGFSILVTGVGFNSQSIVRWNGSDRTTVLLSPTSLMATIPASDIANAGTANVSVFNPAPGGGTSAPVPFAINNPTPVIVSLSPGSATVGGAEISLIVTGAGFNSQSIVRWNGLNRATVLLSPTSLMATIPASDLATAGTNAVTVFNPAPGGGTSNIVTFTVNPRTFSGTVNLLAYSDPTDVPITLKFRPVGGVPGSEVLTAVVNLSPTGTFSINTNLPAGNYDIYADGSIWLQRRLDNVDASDSNITSLVWNLPAGDIDGDGAITPSDYGIWAQNNGSFVTPGEFGDLDGDGAVTPSDYGIWAENNGLFDDE